MRTFVFTLGFHEDYIMRRLSGKSAQRGERILVFTVKPVIQSVRNAFRSLEGFCERVGFERPELVELDLQDTAAAVSAALRVISGVDGLVVADLGGGMRPLGVVVFLALLASKVDFELYVSGEGSDVLEIYVPRGVLRALRGLSEEKLEILRIIGESPGTSVTGIAERLKRNVKTIRNHLSELKSMGLVASRGRGAPLTLTGWGYALVGSPVSRRE